MNNIVLVAYTHQKVFLAVKKTLVGFQGASSGNADYYALLRVGRGDDFGEPLPSAITHIGKIKEIRKNISDEEHLKVYESVPGYKEFFEQMKSDGKWGGEDIEGNSTMYILESLDELPEPIEHKPGNPPRSQIKFFTTLEEIQKAKYIQDLKLLSELK